MKLQVILCVFTCISQDALSQGTETVVLEFLLDLNVQAVAPAPLDKAHPQMRHKLPLLCWDQMPKKESVFPNNWSNKYYNYFQTMVSFNSTALSAQSTYGNLNPNELCYEESEWQMENQSSRHLGKVVSNCAFCFICPSLKFLSGFCDFQVPSSICKCSAQNIQWLFPSTLFPIHLFMDHCVIWPYIIWGTCNNGQ